MRSPMCLLCALCAYVVSHSQTITLQEELTHLRSTSTPEWSDFTTTPQKSLTLYFKVPLNSYYHTIQLTQSNVFRNWTVMLNGENIGQLQQDDNTLTVYYSIPEGALRLNNILTIQQQDTATDDILVGNIYVIHQPVEDHLNEAKVNVTITDRASKQFIPSKITIVNSDGSLQQTGNVSDHHLAVRPGFVYTSDGQATIGLPPGKFKLYASRGFEYGVDSTTVEVNIGDEFTKKLSIAHEVNTDGYVAMDPHVHTYTYSRHGDATARERMITLAGEGIEVPVITDHNLEINLDSVAKAMKVDQYFTLITGNEYTTRVGHFNLFPVNPDSIVPSIHVTNWKELKDQVSKDTPRQVIILNHARDAHSNFTPFAPIRHEQATGKDLEGWPFPANAMEVINSGSQQHDIMELYHDWFGMLNGGHQMTPVGSSDSHDVGRYIVGQARTYVKQNVADISDVSARAIADSLLEGKVNVSFGLLTELEYRDRPAKEDALRKVAVRVQVKGPSWVTAEKVTLFVNGKQVSSMRVASNAGRRAGVKFNGTFTIDKPVEKFYVVAIAQGPDPKVPWWLIPRPYQRRSVEWTPSVIGSSGVLWVN